MSAAIPLAKDAALQLWGGIECTVNRVGNRVADQVRLTGHHDREDDLERLLALGIRTVRYPVLWERTEIRPGEFDWSWPDRRMARLRALGIEPIVTLLHHGSGPMWTSLDDDGFVPGLTRFAGAVAARYPWARMFTVVNEPLTTARFAGLYGFWYPHAKDDRVFVRALLNQCVGIKRAASAIREVIPAATFVQTEDICKVFRRPALAARAAFYNARRWLSLDLLFGRVQPDHSLWRYLLRSDASMQAIEELADGSGRPDIVGLNYYVTSDRFLDDRVERYPDLEPDTADVVPFVDVEVTRVEDRRIAGHRVHLEEAWRRYGTPLALTEVHMGGAREHQLQWLRDAWNGAAAARRSGADVRAVTVWSVFGSFDWNTLVCEPKGYYEPGLFDVRGGQCRATAMAPAVRHLAGGTRFVPPPSRGRGWWSRGARRRQANRHILVTGASGTLGHAFGRLCGARGLAHRSLSRRELDITDRDAVHALVEAERPWAIVNAAGYVRVDDAEQDRERCYRENVTGAVALAEAAVAVGARFVTFSTDLVFDGRSARPYVEGDAVAPLNTYGRTKAEAETGVLGTYPGALVVRTAAFFGPWDRYNTVTRSLQALARGERVVLPDDATVSPTYVPDLVHSALDLLIDDEQGLWHLVNDGAVSWFELVRLAAVRFRLAGSPLEPCAAKDLHQPAARPRFTALATERCPVMPSLESALDRFARELEQPLDARLQAAG